MTEREIVLVVDVDEKVKDSEVIDFIFNSVEQSVLETPAKDPLKDLRVRSATLRFPVISE